jgi:hypothetical protein
VISELQVPLKKTKTTKNSMTKFFLYFSIILLTITATSCASYIIPKESFVKQLAGIDSSKLKSVFVKGPMGDKVTYLANPLDKIVCYDQTGKEVLLINSPSIETRVTLNNDKIVIFYFDRIVLINGIIYGVESRFLNFRTSILLSDIAKIEIQDGKKKFSYVNN